MSYPWDEIQEQFKKGQYLLQEYLLVFIDIETFKPAYIFAKDLEDFWMQYENSKKNSPLKLIYTYDLKAQTLEDVVPGKSVLNIPALPIQADDITITCERDVMGVVTYRFIQNGTELGAYKVSEELIMDNMSMADGHTDFRYWALQQWAKKNNINLLRGDSRVHIIS